MNKWLVSVFMLIVILVCGCVNKDGLAEEKPPDVIIETGKESYHTTLGTYCWHGNGKGVCVDTAGPVELLEGKPPIIVKPGELITFGMEYEPKPNEIHLSQITGETEVEVEVENSQFTAPEEKGIYYYSYGVGWMDEKQENVSNGDAFYAFVLEVE